MPANRSQKRQPEGTPKGGQFAEDARAEAGGTDVLDAADLHDTADEEPATDTWGNELGRGGYPRDFRGSALVVDPNGAVYKSGKKKGLPKLLPYKSASSVAVPTSTAGLDIWKQNQLLSALARDPNLSDRFNQAMADVEPGSSEEKKVLKEFRNEAHEIAETQRAANRGTFAHWLTECQDNGQSPIEELADGEALGIDPDAAQRVMDGWQQLHDDYGLESVAVEARIVNDDLRAAGTTDRLYRLGKDLTFTHDGQEHTLPAGTTVIGDLKTGKLRTTKKGHPRYWQKYAGQLAAYAGGRPYDPQSGERGDWDTAPSQDWAIIVHGDIEQIASGSGSEGFQMFMVDLSEGRNLAEASNTLRESERSANYAMSPLDAPSS